LKIKDLIKKLKKLDPELDVVESSYSYDVMEGYVPATIGLVKVSDNGRDASHFNESEKIKYGARIALRIGKD
jgi:hypothetical protein